MVNFDVKNPQWRNFLGAMILRDLKSRYKLTKLGFYWLIINPILQMIIIGFVFQYFVAIRIDNYFIFLFIGIITWNYFSNTSAKNSTIIINEKALIQKSNFPRETIILSTVFTHLINLLISLTILLVFLLFSHNGNIAKWIWLPIPTLLLVFVTLGVSLILSAMNVKKRDVEFMFSAILPLWYYATPIIYNLAMLPKSISWLFYINPITFIIEIYRYILLGVPIQSVIGCLVGFFIVITILFFGVIFFCRESPDFNDWI